MNSFELIASSFLFRDAAQFWIPEPRLLIVAYNFVGSIRKLQLNIFSTPLNIAWCGLN